jgi:hypothetical protein
LAEGGGTLPAAGERLCVLIILLRGAEGCRILSLSALARDSRRPAAHFYPARARNDSGSGIAGASKFQSGKVAKKN